MPYGILNSEMRLADMMQVAEETQVCLIEVSLFYSKVTNRLSMFRQRNGAMALPHQT